jgi:hypothetical protein
MRSDEVTLSWLRVILLVLTLIMCVGQVMAEAVPVKLSCSEEGSWQLTRGGKPYYIKGAGGEGSKSLLASCGANTIRTWGVGDKLQQELDEAEALGLAVIAGHWLGHGRHGFDYHDPQMLQEQKDRIRHDVLAYKDHPAVLIWGLGNEMEGIGEADDPAVWNHIQDLAAMVKELDPDHPTMTVVADIGGQRVQMIHNLCPDIDIVGINTYGGLPSLPRRYRAAGGTKPYLVTEFGPPGVWETVLNGFGVPPEPNSTQKAAIYRDYYEQGCADESKLCLGACAFYWGAKPEATATWFGMLAPSGEKLGAVDTMIRIWSGNAPDDYCPEIISFEMDGSGIYKQGDRVQARLQSRDPEGEAIQVQWIVHPEAPQYLTFGETWWQPLELGGIIQNSTTNEATLLMPGGGLYRLYVVVRDGRGGAATANVPFKVSGAATLPRAKLPLAVYADGVPSPWAASGWMGDHSALSHDLASTDQPHQGNTCLEARLEPSTSWAGVAWQDPPNDWGDLPGGYDLRGAKHLTFWARGRFGGEIASFGMGLLGTDVLYPDSDTATLEGVKLTNKWKRYRIDLKGKDLSRIKTPFWWSMKGGKGSSVFYLDDIVFE